MKEQPKKRYFFGDNDDFQLQQAVKFLKGEKYLTGFEKIEAENSKQKK